MDKATEQLLNQAQIYQHQIQTVMTQKTALTMEVSEIDKALEEVDKTKEKHVLKVSGPILIQISTKDMKKELGEKKNVIELRLKTIEKQENKLKEKIEELRSKVMKSGPEAG